MAANGAHNEEIKPQHVEDATFDIAEALVGLSLKGVEGQSTPTQATDTKSSISSTKIETPAQDEPKLLTKSHDGLVILQKACDLHKFSRNIRQRDLDSIVERPERTRAAILGILNTKAKLEVLGLPSFDIINCERRGWLGDKAVEAVHGYVYPQDLLALSRDVSSKLAKGELELPDTMPYGDLYLAPQSLDALNGCLGAIYDGIDSLYGDPNYSQVHVCIRPPGHHAAETLPCGFCWINNVHIGIQYAREKYNIKRTAILDFDLHHGDGSQSIAWQLNEISPNSIGYYSLHDIYSYPCETGNVEKISEASVSISAHGHNVHNVHLKPYNDLAQFDEIYEKHYRVLIMKAAQYLKEGFLAGEKCLVCISAGYDASEYESSGMQRHAVNVPTAFYERFTREAVELANTYCHGKVFSVMEGGYGDRAITSAASAHMVGLVSPKSDTTNVSDCYGLGQLKLLEKHWPTKVRNVRKSGKHEPITDTWLQKLDELYLQHISSASPTKTSQSEEDANLSNLQKMTLRDRKPRVATTTTPRSVRSTPLKSTKKAIPPVPKTPAIFETSAMIKDESPTPINRPNTMLDHTPHEMVATVCSKSVEITTQIALPEKSPVNEVGSSLSQGFPPTNILPIVADPSTLPHKEASTSEHAPPSKISNIYDFID